MIQIKGIIESVLSRQYPRPRGVVGRIAGELMVRQHAGETLWTIEAAGVQPADRVLEIGFGAGKAIELLAAQTPRGSVSGIDLAPTMVRRARERNAQAVKAGRVSLQQGEAAHLPFPEQHFDRVISIHTFYFWSDPLEVLTETYRVLKPGGRLIFTLTTGKTEERPETGLERYQTIIEAQVLPHMRRLGFTDVASIAGPPSRQFNICAVVGTRTAAHELY